jgi:hypothetical protein
MDMRAELEWVSYKMTPKAWVAATNEYNRRLVEKQGPNTVTKNPQALLRKLGEMEPKLMGRIIKQDYSCECCQTRPSIRVEGVAALPLTVPCSKEELRGVLAKALRCSATCEGGGRQEKGM